MKKLLIIIFILSSFAASSQTWTQILGRQRFAGGLGIPVKDSTTFMGAADTAVIFINRSDTTGLYWRYKGAVQKVSGGGGGGGTGSVTSVAAGTGMSFTTITTSGSVSVDTAVMATRARVQKQIDSTNALMAAKLNISDTATMLTPYTRYQTGAANRIPYFVGSRTLAGSDSLKWDPTNMRFSIAAPSDYGARMNLYTYGAINGIYIRGGSAATGKAFEVTSDTGSGTVLSYITMQGQGYFNTGGSSAGAIGLNVLNSSNSMMRVNGDGTVYFDADGTTPTYLSKNGTMRYLYNNGGAFAFQSAGGNIILGSDVDSSSYKVQIGAASLLRGVAKYATNYGSLFDSRSLVNKGYVDSAIATGGGAGKLNISDTAAMLANYRTQINTNTTNIATNTANIATNTSNIALKVNYTDTAAMLAPYQKSTTAVKYSDTASMLSPYTRKSTTLTINGTTFDLSADRSWTISGGGSGSGASGQVTYWNGTSTQTGSNNLFWDATNNRLGIGTNTPANSLDVSGTVRFSGAVTGTGNVSNYTVTASSALAASKRITSTLIAAANNDLLVGLDINPTYTNGLFTGIQNIAARVQNGALLIGSALSTSSVSVAPLQINAASSTLLGVILRNSTSTGYSAYRLFNDQNLATRALEINYSGSAYSGSLITNGVAGESAVIATTGNYPLHLGTNSSARLVIFGNGNIGVNTFTDGGFGVDINFSSNPFRVTSTGGLNSILRNTSSTSYASQRFYNDQNTGTRALEMGYSGSSYASAIITGGVTGESGYITTTGNYPFQLGSNNNARLIIFGGGNIGINTATNAGFRLDINGTARVQGDFTITDANNIIIATTTGTKIGTATTQKLGFWNATPVVQPTTSITAATFVANTSGISNDTATFGGYTIGQIVAALKQIGILQ